MGPPCDEWARKEGLYDRMKSSPSASISAAPRMVSGVLVRAKRAGLNWTGMAAQRPLCGAEVKPLSRERRRNSVAATAYSVT